jgi:hypothetical protein
MLRNYTESAGGLIVSGTRFVGWTGAELLAAGSSGDFGPNIWHNKGVDPDKRYRAIITSATGAPFLLREDGSGEASGPFSAVLRLLEDNVEFAAAVELGTSTAGLGMLRNYTEAARGLVVSGTRFVGLTGAEILAETSAGDFGAGIFANHDIATDRRYRALVLTASGASFILRENGSGEAAGQFTATLLLLEDNTPYSTSGSLGVVQIATAQVGIDEVGDDLVSMLLTTAMGYSGAVAFREPADDVVTVRATLSVAIPATIAFREPADDTVSLIGTWGYTQTAEIQVVEEGDDIVILRLVVSGTSVVGGMLASLAAEFETQRAQQGLFIDGAGVLQCAIHAARFYAGWATLEDPTARSGVFSVTGATTVTPDEWAIIKPLFMLYVERESAVAIESSRVMGVELVGRDSSTIAGEIQQVETELPQKAYVEPVQSFGFPVPR